MLRESQSGETWSGAAGVPVVRWASGHAHENLDRVAIEEPLEIRVRGRSISVTMRTPGHDDELAAGFLLTEGVVSRAADIERIEACPRSEAGNLLNVLLAPMVHVDFERLSRHVFAASSCGVCGKATIEAVRAQCRPVASDARFGAAVLAGLPERMRPHQISFDETGGLHAAALFDAEGALVVAR